MSDLLSLFDELERNTSEVETPTILKAPFGYPGGKTRSVKFIIPRLPYNKVYCEPYGGSGTVLLNRNGSELEIFNDRYSGVTDFYRCMRDPVLFNKLIEWLDLTLNSREEWIRCQQTWEDVDDPVERAGRWYYMTEYSWGSLGRVWGRARGGNYKGLNGKIRNKLKAFDAVHQRFRDVQIENMDGIDCLRDYDSKDTVFYVDPPYVGADPKIYKHRCNPDYHRRLLDTIFECQGFVAVSGFPNPLYDNRDWDDVWAWPVFISIQGLRGTEKNNLKDKDHLKRTKVKEHLWIKEAK